MGAPWMEGQTERRSEEERKTRRYLMRNSVGKIEVEVNEALDVNGGQKQMAEWDAHIPMESRDRDCFEHEKGDRMAEI